jgi:hypothetical protein
MIESGAQRVQADAKDRRDWLRGSPATCRPAVRTETPLALRTVADGPDYHSPQGCGL